MRTGHSIPLVALDPPSFPRQAARYAGIAASATRTLPALLLTSIFTLALTQSVTAQEAFLPSPVRSVSTVPANGDLNPYGVAFVPHNFDNSAGPLQHGDILVSNFNDKANVQGTGTTIVRVPASGAPSVFFQGKTGLGLSTALGVLQYGFVIVGNVPIVSSSNPTAAAGSLLVINNQGKLIQTITGPEIQAPWDMALVDSGDKATAYISNGLNGTVTRLNFAVSFSGLKLLSFDTVASGYTHRNDPVTFLVAPTGLVFDSKRDRLYVASTGDNAVFSIPNASTVTKSNGPGLILYQDDTHLHGALGLAMAPNGHLLVTNNDGINPDPAQPSEIVEFTLGGEFVKEIPIDPAQGGSFGLAVQTTGNRSIFAAVDDNTNSLTIWTLNLD